MLVLIVVGAALADAPVWWTEEGVMRRSATFGKAQARDAEAYESVAAELARARKAVGDLELGSALLEPDASRSAYAVRLDRALSGQFLRLQKHVDLLGGDYSRVFGDAVERVISVAAPGQTVTQCTTVSPVQRMLGTGPKCPGRDISAVVGAALDRDLALKSKVESILSVEWPTIAIVGEVQAPLALTGTERSVDVAALGRAWAGDALRALDDEREADLEELQEELDSEIPATKEAAVKKGAAITESWRAAVGELGRKCWPAIKKRLEKAAKTGGPAGVSLCANPVSLGGCGLPDATTAVLAAVAGS
ncbi:MAG: hypothetical protein EXR71_01625 [Myxococcales bacterium]|nr:hypothetical protein [Myxococcales bacterium]